MGVKDAITKSVYIFPEARQKLNKGKLKKLPSIQQRIQRRDLHIPIEDAY